MSESEVLTEEGWRLLRAMRLADKILWLAQVGYVEVEYRPDGCERKQVPHVCVNCSERTS